MRPNCLRNPWFLITFFQGQPLIRIHSRFYLSETWTAADMSCWDSACTNSLATNSTTCSVWNMKSPFWWFLSCLSWKEHKIEIKTMSWKKLTLGLREGPRSLHYRTHIRQREDLGRIEKSLAGDLGLLIITRWLALLKASYCPAGKETLPPRRY